MPPERKGTATGAAAGGTRAPLLAAYGGRGGGAQGESRRGRGPATHSPGDAGEGPRPRGAAMLNFSCGWVCSISARGGREPVTPKAEAERLCLRWGLRRGLVVLWGCSC